MDTSDFALSLVLASAFMHAGWNTLVKAGTQRLFSLAMVDGTALLLCLLALPLVEPPPPAVCGYIAISVVLNTGYRLFLISAYNHGDFGQVYPIVRGIPPVLVALGSSTLLAEPLSGPTYLGVLLICGGILLLSRVRQINATTAKPIITAALAGTFVAAYTIVDAKGVRASDNAWQFIVYLTLCQSIPLPALALIKHKQAFTRQVKQTWHLGIWGGIFSLASYGLVLYAFSLAPVAQVSALRETSVVIAAVIASLFLKETFGLRRFFCATIICCGILLIKLTA